MDTLEYALKLLDIAIECDELYFFLSGNAGFKLSSKDMYGGQEHNYPLAIEAIYKKYETDPSVADKFQESVINSLFNSKNCIFVFNIFNVIKYQMRAEKEGTAPFKLDCDKMLLALKENILRNRDFYIENYREALGGNFENELKVREDDFERNYGRRIL